MKRQTMKPSNWAAAGLAILSPVYLELALHFFIYGQIGSRIVYPILFAVCAGVFIFAVCTCLPGRACGPVFCVLIGLLNFYFEIQLVYNSIFGEFMSIMQLFTGAAAVTNFFRQLLYGMWKIAPKILTMLLPMVLTIVLVCLKKVQVPHFRWYWSVAGIAVFFALHFGAVGVMALGGRSAYSVYGLYTSRDTVTEISVNNIGLLSTTRLELKYMLFPKVTETEAPAAYTPAQEEPVELEPEVEYNMLDLDFDALARSTDNEYLQKLDQYFSTVSPTEKNEYTGLLEGYNLITICAESFSNLLIDEERTPALYKLATGGFVFENYFGTYGSNTTNGEYTFCMGNYPDMSRSKTAASFFASQSNYLPFCLGNEFSNLGVQTWAYHNYSGEYYSRNDTHPNMGYIFQSAGEGLDIEINWPSSDLEMMEASVDDYLANGEPFHAYYMTFSGHYQYDWENPMSKKNKAMTDGLPYSDTVKAFLACNQELEYALEYLLDRLEEAGVADKTVIVLTNDHYPYGLTAEEYNELAGREIDTIFEKFRNSFICYVPDMEPVHVDTYCSTVDILPTLLNLFGLEYDSRLLAGRDVLSQGANQMAVLSDQSFVTKDYGFDAATGQVRVFTEGYTVDEEDLTRRQNLIQNQFRVSLDVLNYDYYAHAFPDGHSPVQKDETEAPLPFTDIPEGISTDCVRFLWKNGYMDPASESKFGYDATGSYAEFLDVLYRMEGNPVVSNVWIDWGSQGPITGRFLDAIKWGVSKNLLNVSPQSLSSYSNIRRKDAAVTILRYAKTMGYSDAVEDENYLQELIAAYPTLTAEEVRALYWCYGNLILRGSNGKLLSLLDYSYNTMTRYEMARMIYNYYVHVMLGS